MQNASEFFSIFSAPGLVWLESYTNNFFMPPENGSVGDSVILFLKMVSFSQSVWTFFNRIKLFPTALEGRKKCWTFESTFCAKTDWKQFTFTPYLISSVGVVDIRFWESEIEDTLRREGSLSLCWFNLRCDAAIQLVCHNNEIGVAGETVKNLNRFARAFVTKMSSSNIHAKWSVWDVIYFRLDQVEKFCKRLNGYVAQTRLIYKTYTSSSKLLVTAVLTTPLQPYDRHWLAETCIYRETYKKMSAVSV